MSSARQRQGKRKQYITENHEETAFNCYFSFIYEILLRIIDTGGFGNPANVPADESNKERSNQPIILLPKNLPIAQKSICTLRHSVLGFAHLSIRLA